MYIALSQDSTPEPRYAVGSLGAYFRSTPFFGVDVDRSRGWSDAPSSPTAPRVIQCCRCGTLPRGRLLRPGLANVYTETHRADGHTIWVHFDNWEGQHASSSPGTSPARFSGCTSTRAKDLDVASHAQHQVLPPCAEPADTKWIKHVRFQSALLSKFWGHPYLGATVLLPQGYDEHPNVRYPVLYEQTHFLQHADNAPIGFTDRQRAAGIGGTPGDQADPPGADQGIQLRVGVRPVQGMDRPAFPAVRRREFLGPTPYYDDSYVVNSATRGHGVMPSCRRAFPISSPTSG